MKKIVLTVAAIFAFAATNAQDLKSTKGENYLPEAGEWAISFNADGIFEYVGNAFNGTAGNDAPSVDFVHENSFVGKKFITDKTAYRVIANLAVGSSTENELDGGANVETKTSGFALAAGLGKEWRRGSTRLQGFYGVDALITVKSETNEESASDPVDGAFISSVETKSGLGLGLGAQGFLGAEYFIFPKFAIGAQYTYRVGFDMTGKGETTFTAADGTSISVDGDDSSSFGLSGVGITSINLTLHF